MQDFERGLQESLAEQLLQGLEGEVAQAARMGVSGSPLTRARKIELIVVAFNHATNIKAMPLLSAVDGLLSAMDVEGAKPEYHQAAINWLKKRWPTLYAAINQVRKARWL